MAYFLKKTKNKKGTYLQIYESYYDPERKGGAHRSYKPIGYVHELQAALRIRLPYLARKCKSSIRNIKGKNSPKKNGRFLKNLQKSYLAISL